MGMPPSSLGSQNTCHGVAGVGQGGATGQPGRRAVGRAGVPALESHDLSRGFAHDGFARWSKRRAAPRPRTPTQLAFWGLMWLSSGSGRQDPRAAGGSAKLTGTMVHVPQGGPPQGCHAATPPGRWGWGTGKSKLRSLCHPMPCRMSL